MKNTETIPLPSQVKLQPGPGGLPKLVIQSEHSTAEVYLHGAHVASFQKKGEPPLLFMSAKSWFAPGKPIRGGVPVCFPWFGPREGDAVHGYARLVEWKLAGASVAQDGAVTIRLRLPDEAAKAPWAALRTEFTVTVGDTLTMELRTTNGSPDRTVEMENCLHTYFQVSDINEVSLAGLQAAPFHDFAAGAAGAPGVDTDSVLRITKETNRVYPNAPGPVEIHDAKWRRTIRVEKTGGRSTVVWNPWTTQKLPDDFDPAEYRQMVCVESGNVKQDRVALAPGQIATLRVVLSSAAMK